MLPENGAVVGSRRIVPKWQDVTSKRRSMRLKRQLVRLKRYFVMLRRIFVTLQQIFDPLRRSFVTLRQIIERLQPIIDPNEEIFDRLRPLFDRLEENCDPFERIFVAPIRQLLTLRALDCDFPRWLGAVGMKGTPRVSGGGMQVGGPAGWRSPGENCGSPAGGDGKWRQIPRFLAGTRAAFARGRRRRWGWNRRRSEMPSR